jgi:ketosteroid isomerase-like protein
MSYFTLTPIESIIKVQQRFWAALQSQSAADFESILAENYRCVSPLEPDQNRSEFIRTLVSMPLTVKSVTCDNLQVDVWGDVAVLTGVQIAHMSFSNGEGVIDKIAITNIFNRVDDEWQMVLSHAVSLPTAV